MVKLPGGFSPVRALQQVGSFANPTGGVADYDIFSESGNQINGVNQNAPLDGSAYGGGATQPDYYGTQDNANTEVLGAGTNGSLGGGSSAPSYDPADLAYLDDQKAGLERQYGRADSILQRTLETILSQFDEQRGLGQKTYDRNVRDLNDKTAISEQGRSRELGKVDTRARMLADSLRQRIGLAGGSNSSAYNVTAPRAVQREASSQRGDVLGDYASNFLALDRNKKDTEVDFADLLSSLTAESTNRENSARADVQGQKNEIDKNLATLERKRAEIRGGSYKDIRNAANPFNQRAQQGESLIDSIYSKYAQKYSANPIQERTTSLKDYSVDNAAVRDQQATGNEYAPYRPFNEDEEEQLV